MPTYVYRCEQGHRFELFHSISDETPKRCPECGAEAKRVPAGGAGLLFKGSGFYITDYRSKGYQDSAKKEGGESGKKEGGTGTKPASGEKSPSRKRGRDAGGGSAGGSGAAGGDAGGGSSQKPEG